MTDTAATGQVIASAAHVYEQLFLPALFAQWPPRLAGVAGLAPGHRVLDVACGTGVLARHAATVVGTGGDVHGIDRNAGMLAVARQVAPDLAWHEGRAEALPWPDDHFDAVFSQFGLMFFDDGAAAVDEMRRVAKPGAPVVLSVWSRLNEAPGYAAMVDLLQELFGDAAADALRAPYRLGDDAALRALVGDHADIRTVPGTASFPSLRTWLESDIKGWTLAEMIDDAGRQLLDRRAPAALARFVADDGSVTFDHPARVVVLHG